MSFTIGITGGTGSGKSFFIRKLAAYFSANQICLLAQDNYYKPLVQQQRDENGIENFDLPEAIDNELFLSQLKKLKKGESIFKTEYTFNNPQAKPKLIELKPAPLIIVEGLFVHYIKSIANELDLKIFIEADEDICLARRIKRDGEERGYDRHDVQYRYHQHAKPVYEKLIAPLKDQADWHILNNGSVTTELEKLVVLLKEKI